jgi:nitrate/nitrite transporter NarK
MDTRSHFLYAVAIVGMFATGAIGSGPTGAFIPELFATRYRYSGSALAVNLAGVLGGAVPPLVAGTLLATYGSWSIGLMLGAFAFTSLVCTYLLPETKGTALGNSPPPNVELSDEIPLRFKGQLSPDESTFGAAKGGR